VNFENRLHLSVRFPLKSFASVEGHGVASTTTAKHSQQQYSKTHICLLTIIIVQNAKFM
jgi:hypothetical protein